MPRATWRRRWPAPRVFIEGRIDVGGQEHFYLEGAGGAGPARGRGATWFVHSSSQHPTEIQHKVADALGLPMNAVRVEVRRMGGGFGGKESQGQPSGHRLRGGGGAHGAARQDAL